MVVETLNINNTTVVFYDDYIKDGGLALKELDIVVEELVNKN